MEIPNVKTEVPGPHMYEFQISTFLVRRKGPLRISNFRTNMSQSRSHVVSFTSVFFLKKKSYS